MSPLRNIQKAHEQQQQTTETETDSSAITCIDVHAQRRGKKSYEAKKHKSQ